MAARTLPNLGLKAFFDLGEDGWKDEMDSNLLALSVLAQGNVISKVSATPGSPAEGDVYLFDASHPTQPNKVAVYENATWTYLTPKEGWLLYNKGADYYEKFGTEWSELETGGGGGGGGGPVSAVTFKGAMVRKAADQTTANYTTASFIAWDAEAYDVGGWHDNVTNNSRLVVPAGVSRVVISANVALTSVAASDFVQISVWKNGANNFEGAAGAITDASLASPFVSFKSAPINVVPGDYFEIRLGIESDTSVTVIADRSNFSIEAVEQAPIASGHLHVREVQASGAAGSASVAAWTTRVLNTTVANTLTGASLAANQITLPAGTYDIDAVLNFFSSASMGHKIRLRDITNGATLLEGMSGWGGASVERGVRLVGRFTLTATTVVAVQAIATGVVAAGWGVNAGITGETNILGDVLIRQAYGTLVPGSVRISAIYEDQKAANTAGGTATSGSWLQRNLTTEVMDDIGISLAANQLTVPAGTYEIDATSQLFSCDMARIRLRDITNGADLLLSDNIYASAANGGSASPRIQGRITLAASTVMEIQYRVTTTRATNGLGVVSNWGVTEIYSRIKLSKIS